MPQSRQGNWSFFPLFKLANVFILTASFILLTLINANETWLELQSRVIFSAFFYHITLLPTLLIATFSRQICFARIIICFVTTVVLFWFVPLWEIQTILSLELTSPTHAVAVLIINGAFLSIVFFNRIFSVLFSSLTPIAALITILFGGFWISFSSPIKATWSWDPIELTSFLLIAIPTLLHHTYGHLSVLASVMLVFQAATRLFRFSPTSSSHHLLSQEQEIAFSIKNATNFNSEILERCFNNTCVSFWQNKLLISIILIYLCWVLCAFTSLSVRSTTFAHIACKTTTQVVNLQKKSTKITNVLLCCVMISALALSPIPNIQLTLSLPLLLCLCFLSINSNKKSQSIKLFIFHAPIFSTFSWIMFSTATIFQETSSITLFIFFFSPIFLKSFRQPQKVSRFTKGF